MTKKKLVDMIENGNDIMFDVSGKHFTILTWMDDGIAISEQHPNDGELQYFDSAEELVDSFEVDGKALALLAERIEITQYT